MSEVGAKLTSVDGSGRGDIDGDVIRDYLVDHVRHGRNPAEAAGEQQWLSETQAKAGILSRGSVEDIAAVVDAWLVEEMGEDHAALGRTGARMYADFLRGHVDLKELTNPPREIVDRAWREWRAQAELR